jgi:hypothetical protein
VLSLLAGCAAFAPEDRVKVELPPLPDHWARTFPGIGAVLVVTGPAGRVRRIPVAGWNAEVLFDCPKAGTTPVLAYPARDGLRPAGGVYPSSLGGGGQVCSLALSWQGGPMAYVLSLVRGQGIDCSLFNTRRLAEYLAGVADPWDIDLEGVAEKIARGDFTAYDIDALPARDQRARPGPGQWFLESPFRDLLPAEPDGSLTLAGLADGTHTLFSVEGDEVRLWSGSGGIVLGLLPCIPALVGPRHQLRGVLRKAYGSRMIRALVRTRLPVPVISTSFSHRTPPCPGW